MKGYEFIDNKGTFKLEDPDLYSYLYFPVGAASGMMGSLTPEFGGDLKTSQKLMKKVCDIVDILVEFGGVAAGKAMCAVHGVDLGTVRVPLKPLTKEQKTGIVSRLKKIGYK